MRIRALGCAMALALAACSTTHVTYDETFSGGPGQSYVVVATDTDVPLEGSENFVFQQVDMASSTFLPGKFVYVGFIGRNAWGSDRALQKPEKSTGRMPPPEDSSLRFGGTKAAPGYYALVAHNVRQPPLGIYINCYARGAAIYRFQEGVINIVRMGKGGGLDVISGAANAVEVQDLPTLRAQVAEVLAGYPNMTAPTAVAKVLGAASFASGTKTCNTTGGFSFTRGPAVSVDW